MEQAEEGWDSLPLGCGLVLAAAALFFLRQWIKGAQFREKCSAKGKVVLVTGANSGIGRQLVKELNLKGAKVYLLVRQEERGQAAVRWMLNYGCDPTRLLVRQCDLCSFASVRKFVKEFEKGESDRFRCSRLEEDHVDILINNAGVMFVPTYKTTEDGNELVAQSNHLGHFLLTELLIPRLEAAPEARVVNVSSKLHSTADCADLDVMDSKARYGILQSYARSKLANVSRIRRVRSLFCGSGDARGRTDPSSAASEQRNARHRQRLPPWRRGHQPGPLHDLPGLPEEAVQAVHLVLHEDGPGRRADAALLRAQQEVGGRLGPLLQVSARPRPIGCLSDCAEAEAHPLVEDESACQLLYNQSLEACGVRSRD